MSQPLRPRPRKPSAEILTTDHTEGSQTSTYLELLKADLAKQEIARDEKRNEFFILEGSVQTLRSQVQYLENQGKAN